MDRPWVVNFESKMFERLTAKHAKILRKVREVFNLAKTRSRKVLFSQLFVLNTYNKFDSKNIFVRFASTFALFAVK